MASEFIVRQPVNAPSFIGDGSQLTNIVTSLTAGTGISLSASSGSITISSSAIGGGVSSFNTRNGDITLSSSDVENALGYLPLSTTGIAFDSFRLGGLPASGYSLFGHNHNLEYLGINATAADSNKFGGVLPSGYALSEHTHTISNVSGLQEELDSKSSVDHNHNLIYLGAGDTAKDSVKLGGVAASGYALSEHTHNYEPKITVLPISKGGTGVSTVSSGAVLVGHATTDGFAPSWRRLSANDIPNLLSLYSAIGHNHNTLYLGIHDTAEDSLKLGGIAASGYASSTHNHNSQYLGINATAADSNKLGGLSPSAYASTNHTHDNNGSIGGPYSLSTHNHNSTYLGINATATDSAKLGGVLPSGYALSGHTHTIANITGLQTALDGKSATTHTHTNDGSIGGPYALSSHTHSYLPLSGGTLSGGLSVFRNLTVTTDNSIFVPSIKFTSNRAWDATIDMADNGWLKLRSGVAGVQLTAASSNVFFYTNGNFKIPGRLYFGDPEDTSIYRSASGVLKTDGYIQQAGMPTFRAHSNIVQTLTGLNYTKLLFQTKDWDSRNWYNTSNSRFTNNEEDGIFLVSAGFHNNVGTTHRAILEVRVFNSLGVNTKTTLLQDHSTEYCAHGNTIININKNEYIEIYAYIPLQNTTAPGSRNVYFSACRLD